MKITVPRKNIFALAVFCLFASAITACHTSAGPATGGSDAGVFRLSAPIGGEGLPGDAAGGGGGGTVSDGEVPGGEAGGSIAIPDIETPPEEGSAAAPSADDAREHSPMVAPSPEIGAAGPSDGDGAAAPAGEVADGAPAAGASAAEGGAAVAQGDGAEAGVDDRGGDLADGGGRGDDAAAGAVDAGAPPARVVVSAATCEGVPGALPCTRPEMPYHPAKALVVDWDLANVKSAFLRIASLEHGGAAARFSAVTPFIGDDARPYLGLHSGADAVDDTFAAQLLKDPNDGFDGLSQEVKQRIWDDTEALPYATCDTAPDSPERRCFARQREFIAQQIVFFPIRPEETERRGQWLLQMDAGVSSFTIASEDLSGTIRTETVIIINRSHHQAADANVIGANEQASPPPVVMNQSSPQPDFRNRPPDGVGGARVLSSSGQGIMTRRGDSWSVSRGRVEERGVGR